MTKTENEPPNAWAARAVFGSIVAGRLFAFVQRGDNGNANDTNALIAEIVKLRAEMEERVRAFEEQTRTQTEELAERRIERGVTGRRHIARAIRPRCRRRERDIELAGAQQRFEFGAGGGGRHFRFLFAFGREYSAAAFRDQGEARPSV